MYRTRRRKALFISSILLFTIAVVILKTRKRGYGGTDDESKTTWGSMFPLFNFNTPRLQLDERKKLTPNEGLNVAIWEDMCGFEMLTLKEFPLFPHGPTTRLRTSRLRMHFASSPTKFENFGLRIFGFLTPRDSGDYNFYLASSGTSELWISSDSKPENSKLIGNVTLGLSFRDLQSAIPLNTGKRYYIEILHKHGSQDKEKLNFLHLKWKSSSWGEQELREIPSNVLSPFEDDLDFEKIKLNSLPSQQLQANDVVLPMHIKRRDPAFVNDDVRRRSEMYRLPFIAEEDTRDLFVRCHYNPSYIVKKPLQRYQGTWETHYTSIYPYDHSDVKQKLWNSPDFVTFGNDLMDETTAKAIVSQVWMKLQRKHPG